MRACDLSALFKRENLNFPLYATTLNVSENNQPEWNIFGYFKRFSLQEEAVEIYVNGVTISHVTENVLSVSISEPHDEPNLRLVRASKVVRYWARALMRMKILLQRENPPTDRWIHIIR